jgi:hypothetical protein
LSATNAKASDADLTSPEKADSIKQWFRGEIEASYYGVPSRVPAASSDSVGRRYRLHIYRAAMLRAEPTSEPAAANETTDDPFFQSSIEVAQLWGLRGPGTRCEGSIHDVSITQVQTRFHIVKDNKSYGTLRGYAQGWIYLPAVEALVPPKLEVPDRTKMQIGAVVQELLPDNAVGEVAHTDRAPTINRARNSATNREQSVRDVSVDDERPVKRTLSANNTGDKTEPPYFSLCAALGLLLWFTCGVEQTSIWFLFMLPTLGMRRLVLGVLPEDRGIQAFSAVMVLGAILSTGTILASFNTPNCWALETMPLVVLVGSVFLSGIVPYRLPVAITAIAFAGVLYVWGHTPERHCLTDVTGESLPTIKDPGVPRTNDDGSWPRRAPVSEND